MKRLLRLIPAANGLEPLNATLLAPEPADPADLPAANSRIVQGVCTIPYGDWPITLVNREGKAERVVQRLNKDSAQRLVAAWNSLRGRVAAMLGNGSVYLGHPDYRPIGAANSAAPNPNAWKRLGKVISLAAGENALTIETELTDEAKALCAANEAIAPSPHWGLARTSETNAAGHSICVPAVFWTLGLVTRPNIAGAAINGTGGPHVAPDQPAATPPPAPSPDPAEIAAANERALATIAADLAEAERQLNAAWRERDARTQELAARDATIADLIARSAVLDAQIQTLRAELKAAVEADALAKAATEAAAAARKQVEDAAAAQADAAATAMSDTLDSICSAAANAGLILPADVPHWKAKLAAANSAIAELIAPDRVRKSESVVSASRLAAANAALGGVSAATRFEQLVRAHQNATGQNWPTAFNAMRAAHPELYNLMPNGGRA